jgi:hypothetical protein
MKKVDIIKLQLDAFMKPHVMWRIVVEKNVTETPLELIQSQSPWEWDEEVEHDAMAALLCQPKRFEFLVQEVTEVCLMDIDQYDNINNSEFSELAWYVHSKLESVIANEAFHKEIYTFFRKMFLDYESSINDLIK